MRARIETPAAATVFATLFAVLSILFFLDTRRVNGFSMRPTLYPGQVICINKMAYGLKLPFTGTYLLSWGGPSRGDVVVFRNPEEGSMVVKRTLGVAGDPIVFGHGGLIVGGMFIPLTDRQRNQFARITEVPRGTIFVTGDNSDNSIDSRDYGFIYVEEIIGKVILFP